MTRARHISPLILLLALLLSVLTPLILQAKDNGKKDKILVSKVVFVGNENVSSTDLLPMMIMRPTGVFGFFNDVEYNPHILEEDLGYIELYYQQHGWLEAKVLSHNVEIDSSDHEAKITITLEEGPRTYVTDVMPLGNEAFSDEYLLDQFGIEPGDPLNRVKNREGSERIVRRYAEQGYLEASVNPAVMVDKQNQEAFIDLSVTEGTQFRVGQIVMSGFTNTKSFVVRRELTFSSGEILDYSALSTTQRNLYETSLFRSVFVRQEESITGDSTSKDVLIEVVERPPILFTSSVGYATLEKLRGRVGVRNENIFGTGRAAGVETWLSFIDRGVELSYKEPWTLGFHWTTDVTLTGEYRNEPSYDYTRYQGKVALSRRVFQRGFFTVSYRHENAEYTNIDVFDFNEETSPRIRSLSQTLSYDTRNDPFSPTKGWFGSVVNEYALKFLGSTNEFFKTRVNYRVFFPLRDGTVLATNIEGGWVDAGGGLSDIPLSERLYAGGPNVLRGFPYRSLGPVDGDDGTPLGGRAKLAWNVLEIRQHLWRWFGAVAFYDVGNVFEQTDVLRFDDLRHSPGVGLRFTTPIGLFRLDYGFNIFPKPGEDPGAFQISIGHAF